MSSLPILYSFRRCPYAIRARMALTYSGIHVELREVALNNKPADMLATSAKGTVPVLVLQDGQVIDESIDIMRWALSVKDPDNWQSPTCTDNLETWLRSNDGPFKAMLDRYKYADRHPEHTADWYRDQTSDYLNRLNAALGDAAWLHGGHMGLADVALFPFLRQFAMVDFTWFSSSPYHALQLWLARWLEHPLFTAVMDKHPPWQPGQNHAIL